MPKLYFFPSASTVDAEQVLATVRSSLAGLPGHEEPTTAVLSSLPGIVDRDGVLASLPKEAREATLRYWATKESDLSARAAEMLPEEPSGDLRFGCLAAEWGGHPARTIVGVRDAQPVGVLAVFAGWVVDGSGRIDHALLPVVKPKVDPRAVWVGDGDIGQDIFKNSIDLIAYIADGIADGFPIVGKLVKAILGLISDSAKSAMGGVNMLDKFAQQLKASDAQLETDLASADIMTYQFWAAGHYQDQWVADVVKGTITNDNRSALAQFASTVALDLDDRNSRILTAANLMMTQKPTPNDNLDYPTLAMLKSNGFFYLANYVLTLGRQAFNAQLALEGNAAAAKTGALLVRLSTVYTAYATALKAAVDQQYAARVGYMQLSIDHAHTQIDIIDNWDPDPSNRPAASRIWTVSYCGNDDFNAKWAQAQVEFANRLAAYHRSFWAGDPVTRDQAVAAMQTNDTLLQGLTKPP